MTSAPRSRPRDEGRPRWKGLLVGFVGVWHAGCIVLTNTGCFVTWEMPILDVNDPPEMVAALHDDGDLVSFDEDLPFFIAARDPDSNAPLLFLWQVDNTRLFDVSYVTQAAGGDQGGDVWESDVTVPWDEEFDGAELTVKIVDAGGATTRAAWTLEVL